MLKYLFIVMALLLGAVPLACRAEQGEHPDVARETLTVATGNPRAPCPPGASHCADLYVVAHEDDDSLFMNPDIETSLAHGNNVVVVFLTAGQNWPSDGSWDDATKERYWTDRERGILAAYGQMTNPAAAWTAQREAFAMPAPDPSGTTRYVARFDHPLATAYPGRTVTLYFMRLLDGGLENLWSDGAQGEVNGLTCSNHCADPNTASTSVAYKRFEVLGVLGQIMRRFSADSVSALDATGLYFAASSGPEASGLAENGSHFVAGLFALEAALEYQASVIRSVFLRLYRGYTLNQEPPNLSDAETTEKQRVFSAYRVWDCMTDSAYGPVVPCGSPDPNNCDPHLHPDHGCPSFSEFWSRVGSTRTLLGTGPLKGRLSIASGCLAVSGSRAVTSTSCDTAPSWVITPRNQIQLAGTSNCLKVSDTDHSVGLSPCAPQSIDSTFFALTNGQIWARVPASPAPPIAAPPHPFGSCLVGSTTNGGPVTWDYCARNCVDEATGAQSPSCAASLKACDADHPDNGTCASTEYCLSSWNGPQCFARAAGTPTAAQSWTLLFDPLALRSADFADTTEIGSSGAYYRTFGIAGKQVCVRRATGVYCASSDLALQSKVVASSSYEVAPWGRNNVVDGRESSVGSTFGYSSQPGISSSHIEYVEVDLPSVMTLDTIVLYPRNDPGHIGQGFPIDFQLQVWDGSAWITRVTRSSYGQPENSGQAFSWGFADRTNKVRIYATKLAQISGDYLLQLAEIDVFNSGALSAPSLAPARQLTGEFADSAGWSIAPNGSTVSTTWDSSALSAVACGRGYYGIECSNGLSSADYSNAQGWIAGAYYYDSIRFVDVNGDAQPDVCGRGYYGIMCSLKQGTAFASATSWSSNFSAAEQWNRNGIGDTIQYGDVNGDEQIDVCGRGDDGIYCATGASGVFVDHHIWSADRDPRRGPPSYATGVRRDYSNSDADAAWMSSEGYYASIKVVDVNRDGFADVCGRGAAGVYCAFSNGHGFGAKRLVSGDLADSFGWNAGSYGGTLSFGDLDGDTRVEFCARGIGGIACASGY